MNLRKPLAYGAAALVVVGLWVAYGRDGEVRRQVLAWGGGLTDGLSLSAEPRRGEGANWGDVATKIGEFSAQERELREAVGQAGRAAGRPAD